MRLWERPHQATSRAANTSSSHALHHAPANFSTSTILIVRRCSWSISNSWCILIGRRSERGARFGRTGRPGSRRRSGPWLSPARRSDGRGRIVNGGPIERPARAIPKSFSACTQPTLIAGLCHIRRRQGPRLRLLGPGRRPSDQRQGARLVLLVPGAQLEATVEVVDDPARLLEGLPVHEVGRRVLLVAVLALERASGQRRRPTWERYRRAGAACSDRNKRDRGQRRGRCQPCSAPEWCASRRPSHGRRP
jgi:hypothetical protein